ncbi:MULTISPECIES: hypothetical protein [unclassified Microbacterium]|uniref:hypothetical protein n=1 Tax=unclassified Microbacterium TaxID=2609290 RepID=UPI0012F952BF|nr:hypothetical protein [Microbacterium sp. MAH-37]MVQ43324.1 hypothetical protein [Microbacterium sp. MAH-37]
MSDPFDAPREARPSVDPLAGPGVVEQEIEDQLDEEELRDDGLREEALDDPLWDEDEE